MRVGWGPMLIELLLYLRTYYGGLKVWVRYGTGIIYMVVVVCFGWKAFCIMWIGDCVHPGEWVGNIITKIIACERVFRRGICHKSCVV